MPKQIKTLERVSMFGALDRATMEKINRRCTWREVKAKEWVIDYQDHGMDVFFVVAGSVRVLIYSTSGREVILADIAQDEFFGELAPIDGHPRSAGVLAMSDALVATMPGAVFMEILSTYAGVAMHVLKLLAARVRLLDNRVLEYSTLQVRQRISCELLRLAQRDPNDARRGIIAPKPTHSEIAARISTHREAVAREMKLLEREGCIQRNRTGLVLPDIPRMVERLKNEE